MKRVVLFLAMLMVVVSVEADTMRAGKMVWHAEYQQEPVITVTMGVSAETGADLVEVWVHPDKTYQEYPLNSVGYNGSVVLIRVQEVRPGQAATDKPTTRGMRDPGTLFRAMKTVYAVILSQEGGGIMVLEIREVGENYLIVVTRVIPQRGTTPPPQAM